MLEHHPPITLPKIELALVPTNYSQPIFLPIEPHDDFLLCLIKIMDSMVEDFSYMRIFPPLVLTSDFVRNEPFKTNDMIRRVFAVLLQSNPAYVIYNI